MSYESTSARARAEKKKVLTGAFKNVGERRAYAVKALAEIGDDFAFSLRYGKALFHSTGKGTEFELAVENINGEDVDDAKLKDDRSRSDAADPRILRADFGAVYGNKKVSGLTIPCGLVGIVAGGGAGKSPLSHVLASSGVESYGVVRVGEPLAGYDTSDSRGAADIARAMVEHSDVVVDSIKDLLSGGGGLLRSGISREALTTLSRWSTLAIHLGCTLYVPINPSTPEAEVLTLLIEIVRSNATAVIAHKGGQTWECYARQGEELNRIVTQFQFTEQDGGRVVVSGSQTPREIAEREVSINVARNIANWDGVVSRALVSITNTNQE